jgi:hypothetical protein
MPPKKQTAPAWYAVKTGRTPGVYRTWAECEAQVKGVSGAEFKKFGCEHDAMLFAGLRPNLVSQPRVYAAAELLPCLYVDGGCNPMTLGDSDCPGCAYGSVVEHAGRDVLPDHAHLLRDMDLAWRDLPVGRRLVILARFGDVAQQQNNGAELLAAVAGLRIAVQSAMDDGGTDTGTDTGNNTGNNTGTGQWPRVLSDSTLIVQYWSMRCNAPYLDPRKKAFVRELIALRRAYEQAGGQLLHVSGDDNLADLGFHK